jgi:hypothetical protein
MYSFDSIELNLSASVSNHGHRLLDRADKPAPWLLVGLIGWLGGLLQAFLLLES